MNYELTAQEKINILEANIKQLKQTPFNNFEENEREFLINTLQEQVNFLKNEPEIDIKLDDLKIIIKETVNQVLNEAVEKLKSEQKAKKDQLLKSQFENKGL